FLLFCYFVIIGNQILYYFVSDPKYNFANNYYLAKELSKELKKQEIFKLRVGTSLQPRLKFYDIEDSNTFYLKSIKNKDQLDKNKKNITIKLGKFEKIYQIQRY
ncbi:hypothetical protein CQW11_07210, partial [Campylobacter coli]|nr:hypothetical protein [Campylobacter coli]